MICGHKTYLPSFLVSEMAMTDYYKPSCVERFLARKPTYSAMVKQAGFVL